MARSSVVPIGVKVRMDDRMKVALNAMPVAVSWNRIDDGTVEFMNQRFTDLTGYTSREVGTVAELITKIFASREQGEGAIATINNLQSQVEPFEFPEKEVLLVDKRGRHVFTRFSGVLLPEANMSLAMFVDISGEKEREARLSAIAAEDSLTGLLNRRAFDAELARVLLNNPQGQAVALIVLDLDGFKAINDTLGHAVGDAVLRRFAEILRSTFRRSDVVSRWGGDEFGVLIQNPPSRSDVETALKRLQGSLIEPILIGSDEFRISVSAGLAFYPDEALEATKLYQVADEAMYSSKRRKRR